VAVDHTSGAIYVVWQDNRFGPRSSIALSQSLDGGATWSPPIRVNQTPPADPGEPAGNNQAFTPMVQVLSDGTVAVSYYDFRNNTADVAPPPRPTRSWSTATPAAPTPPTGATRSA
jgi:hypothetical protein